MLPSAPFDVAKSLFAGMIIVQLKAGETTHVFESKLLKHKIDQEKKKIQRPDRKGVLRTVRTIVTKQDESLSLECDEAKRLPAIFSGALAGNVGGVTATVWMPDPADDTGKVALKSEDNFKCSVIRDGDLDFGNSELSKCNLVIESEADHLIVFTPDAIVGNPPVITRQPADTNNVEAGVGAIYIDIEATGDITNYTWRRNGLPVASGPAKTSYMLGQPTAAASGDYDCVVSGPYGEVTSTVCVVTVA
jgi:hypothetical protein